MPSLIVQSGKHKGKKIELPDREVVIGRDESCFIRMTSNEVSRQHCAVSLRAEGVYVRDLQSQNGTLVNAVRIENEQVLRDGDVLQVGPVQFEIAGTKVDIDVAYWQKAGGSSEGRHRVGERPGGLGEGTEGRAQAPPR